MSGGCRNEPRDLRGFADDHESGQSKRAEDDEDEIATDRAARITLHPTLSTAGRLCGRSETRELLPALTPGHCQLERESRAQADGRIAPTTWARLNSHVSAGRRWKLSMSHRLEEMPETSQRSEDAGLVSGQDHARLEVCGLAQGASPSSASSRPNICFFTFRCWRRDTSQSDIHLIAGYARQTACCGIRLCRSCPSARRSNGF